MTARPGAAPTRSVRLIAPLDARLRRERGSGAGSPTAPANWRSHRRPKNRAAGHVVLCGHDRPGHVIARMLRERQLPLVVVEDRAVALQRRCRQAGDLVLWITSQKLPAQVRRVL